jgi:hypothetical protein
MSMIQLDMFEVQLGAAILMQFCTERGLVRVLADAGVKASGYPNDHVLKKLNPLLATGGRRLDLVIGTHYDEDHLNGLVPIIDDHTIGIGEAWMPPVANDTYPIKDRAIRPRDLLANQFSGENGRAALVAYLETKLRDIETLQRFEAVLLRREVSDEWSNRDPGQRFRYGEPDLSFFRNQLRDETRDPADHGVENDVESRSIVEQLLSSTRRNRNWLWISPYDPLRELRDRAADISRNTPGIAMAQARSLGAIRRSTAKDAINAKALHDVVQALGRRRIPVRSKILDDGVPRTYRWTAARRRFVLSRQAQQGFTFTLLGPSRSLVRKHRDRLPVLAATLAAFQFSGEIRSITPSNQLSYIGRFDFQGQRILITGDAGCVDSSTAAKATFPG